MWTDLVANCDLFTSAPNCLNGGVADAKTGNDCQRPYQSTSWWLFSATQGKFGIAPQYDYGTGIVPNAGSDWTTVQGEGVSSQFCLTGCRMHDFLHDPVSVLMQYRFWSTVGRDV